MQCSACAITSMDLLAKRIDHLPVMLRFAACPPVAGGIAASCRRVLAHCQAVLVRDTDRVDAFAECLDYVRICYDGDVDTVLKEDTEKACDAAAARFTQEGIVPRKNWIRPLRGP